MVLLIGLGLLALGIVSGVAAVLQFDDSPVLWFRGLCFILVVPCVTCGVVGTLVGLGIWLGHPHTLHF